METMTTDQDSFYMSAPTSPDGLSFYSVPTSPIRKPSKSFYDAESEPTTPLSHEDASSGFIDFEFDTSRFNLAVYDNKFETSPTFEIPCVQVQQKQKQQEKCTGSSLTAMAFADELFCDGKVMPLKPPPCLQYCNSVGCSSTLSSPRSPSGRLKFSFQRRSLWNDDFDPFMAALEIVKEEQKEKTQRRARSMSPLLARSPEEHGNGSISLKNHQGIKQSRSDLDWHTELSASGPCSMWEPNQKGNMGRHEQRIPIRLSEPKGILYARRARIAKMGHEKPEKPSLRKEPESGETGECLKEAEGRNRRRSKRQKIKKFLLRSTGRTCNEEQKKDESDRFSERSYSRNLSFKSMKLAQYNEEKRVSEVTKISTIQDRPKIFPCMGFRTTYAD